MKSWWQASAGELADAYRARQASPVQVIEGALERCAALNPALNAVVTLDAAGARTAARASEARWRAGRPLSALDGVPITVKDSIPVAGMRSTWGSRLYAEYVPDRDETPVARLRAAGAVVIGKTNVPEFTLQGYTSNPLFGVTRNPWNPALTPGGSSGGAVASVAAGIVPLAIGTDGGGSIRRPASHTGLVGLKPSLGRVPRRDGFPPILLDFEVVGPMARAVHDVVAAMQVISVPSFEVPPARRLRILFAPTFGDAPVDPEIAALVRAAVQRLEALGHAIEEAPGFQLPLEANEAWPAISQVGLAWLLSSHGDWRGRVGPALAAMADAGADVPATRYFDALQAVQRTRERVRELFERHDVLLTPSAAALPWPAELTHPDTIAGRAVPPRGHAVFTAFANAAGVPAISVPCGFSASGLPVGLQLVGPQGADGRLCALAAQYESAAPWRGRWPSLLNERAPA